VIKERERRGMEAEARRKAAAGEAPGGRDAGRASASRSAWPSAAARSEGAGREGHADRSDARGGHGTRGDDGGGRRARDDDRGWPGANERGGRDARGDERGRPQDGHGGGRDARAEDRGEYRSDRGGGRDSGRGGGRDGAADGHRMPPGDERGRRGDGWERAGRRAHSPSREEHARGRPRLRSRSRSVRHPCSHSPRPERQAPGQGSERGGRGARSASRELRGGREEAGDRARPCAGGGDAAAARPSGSRAEPNGRGGAAREWADRRKRSRSRSTGSAARDAKRGWPSAERGGPEAGPTPSLSPGAGGADAARPDDAELDPEFSIGSPSLSPDASPEAAAAQEQPAGAAWDARGQPGDTPPAARPRPQDDARAWAQDGSAVGAVEAHAAGPARLGAPVAQLVPREPGAAARDAEREKALGTRGGAAPDAAAPREQNGDPAAHRSERQRGGAPGAAAPRGAGAPPPPPEALADRFDEGRIFCCECALPYPTLRSPSLRTTAACINGIGDWLQVS
jgi:hypothetical protein